MRRTGPTAAWPPASTAHQSHAPRRPLRRSRSPTARARPACRRSAAAATPASRRRARHRPRSPPPATARGTRPAAAAGRPTGPRAGGRGRPAAPPPRSRRRWTGASQPLAPASAKAATSGGEAAVRRVAAIASTRRWAVRSDRASRRHAIATAATTAGTLTRNTQRHEAYWTMTPPNNAPPDAATAPTAPQSPSARVRSRPPGTRAGARRARRARSSPRRGPAGHGRRAGTACPSAAAEQRAGAEQRQSGDEWSGCRAGRTAGRRAAGTRRT